MADQNQNNNPDANNIEEVAVSGSPNTVNNVHFDVRDTYLRNPLLGSLVTLNVPIQGVDGNEQLIVLGQIAKIETINRWHEDASLKNYIKLHGRLPHLTEIGDNSSGILQVIGAYRQEYTENDQPDFTKLRLSVPPGSGLPITMVDGNTIRNIMRNEFGYGYIGQFYGTTNVPAPVYIRHFGDFEDRGSGEAYMGGVFGPSGSGKSVVAASLIALWAHNPQIGILILDPQSEFSNNAFAGGTEFDFDFHDILRRTSRRRFDPNRDIIRLDEIQLEGVEIFVQILVEKDFFNMLGVGAPKIQEASENVQRLLADLFQGNEWEPSLDWEAVNALQIPPDEDEGTSFSTLITLAVANAYAASSRNARARDFNNEWENQSRSLSLIWDETVELFSPTAPNGQQRYLLRTILEDAILRGRIRILDLNPQVINMSTRFKTYLMDFVFKRLRQLTYIAYRQNRPGNCLIVLDEAGRYIPQDPGDDSNLRRLTRALTESVKEMRKMRCGFMFITQTIAEIQKEIFRNLHFRIYGVGLGVGVDADHLRSREGNEAFELYRSLPDPRLSGTFSFMVSGVLLALGSSGRPMVIEGFSSGTELIQSNSHIVDTNENLAIGEVVEE